MQTILILTKDLMMQSSASAAARDAGYRLRACGSVGRLTERLVEEAPIAGIFVDLQTPELSMEELAQALDIDQAPSTIAFAQHVEEELLANAKIDCIDAILTRGQFSRELPALVGKLSG